MKYTSIHGREIELTPKVWRNIRRVANNRFDGSTALFDSCWRKYREYLKGAIDDPKNIDGVMDWLNQIAADKVNDGQSRFYIYG